MKKEIKMNKKTREALVNKNIQSKEKAMNRILVGIPSTGLVRIEWVLARYNQIIPTNWSHAETLQMYDSNSPVGFSVADARNIIANKAVVEDWEWLVFIDHDVKLPATFFVWMNEIILHEKIPCWSGLYFTKSVPAEPLIYKGRGNGYFTNFKLGERVWCDGLPMGCTVINVKLLKAMYEEEPSYNVQGLTLKKIFETPNNLFVDPQTLNWFVSTGTEDLNWCSRVIKNRIFDKAGFPEYQEKLHPFMIDTTMFCYHLDTNGRHFPSKGEEARFMKKRK